MIKKFKRDIDEIIRQKLMKSECPPRNIEQYERMVNLDSYWRKSK